MPKVTNRLTNELFYIFSDQGRKRNSWPSRICGMLLFHFLFICMLHWLRFFLFCLLKYTKKDPFKDLRTYYMTNRIIIMLVPDLAHLNLVFLSDLSGCDLKQLVFRFFLLKLNQLISFLKTKNPGPTRSRGSKRIQRTQRRKRITGLF